MTDNRPDFLKTCDRARLFPVLAETSKEGRATSILLACISFVREFADLLLSSLGRKVGSRARVACYTEIVFKASSSEGKLRPDGLIVVTIGERKWCALIESKIGNSRLENEQVESYLRLARENEIDAIITVSNEFATQPTHHPLTISGKLLNKVKLYHWSWMYLLTQADLLLTTNSIEDKDQHLILEEFKRFLTHSSTGVSGFTTMPAAWSDLVQTVSAGGQISAKAEAVAEVVQAWHMEIRDLALILSRQLGVNASVRLSRAEAKDSAQRLRNDAKRLQENQSMDAQILVPGAAAALEIQADLRGRTILISMRLRAPEDRKSTKARVNWLLRQLPAIEGDYYLRLHWPGRGGFTQHSLAQLREAPDRAQKERPNLAVHSFDVCLIRSASTRFGQRKNFIQDLEDLVPTFYKTIGENLKPWQAPAPKVRRGRDEAEDVTPEALADSNEVSRDHAEAVPDESGER